MGRSGTVLGLILALLDASWLFFGRSKSNFFQALAQDGLLNRFWFDLGRDWDGFWEHLGRFGEDFPLFWLPLGRFVQEAFEMIWGGF